ncbi:Retinoblastoma-related protein 1 [Glycine max]|nr:Retinoblastoma-related protein 1 [Glycine max]
MSTPLATMSSRIFNTSPRLLPRPSNKPPSVTVRSTAPRGRSLPLSLPPRSPTLLDNNNPATKGTVRTRFFTHRAENTNTTTRSSNGPDIGHDHPGNDASYCYTYLLFNNIANFFKELPQFVVKAGPTLSNLYGTDWENWLETNDDACSMECKSELLKILKLINEAYIGT